MISVGTAAVSLSFAQFRSGGRLCELGFGAFHEHRDGVGKLGAVLRPVGDAIVSDPQAFFLFGRHRVVKADALNESAIAPIA